MPPIVTSAGIERQAAKVFAYATGPVRGHGHHPGGHRRVRLLRTGGAAAPLGTASGPLQPGTADPPDRQQVAIDLAGGLAGLVGVDERPTVAEDGVAVCSGLVDDGEVGWRDVGFLGRVVPVPTLAAQAGSKLER